MTHKFTKSKLDNVIEKIKSFVNDDGPYILLLERAKQKRSLAANRYMWGVVYSVIADHTGYTPREVHQIMGEKFLTYQSGDRTFIRSTTDLDSKEFTDYIEQVRQFAQDQMDCYIPSANEVDNETWLLLQSKYNT